MATPRGLTYVRPSLQKDVALALGLIGKARQGHADATRGRAGYVPLPAHCRLCAAPSQWLTAGLFLELLEQAAQLKYWTRLTGRQQRVSQEPLAVERPADDGRRRLATDPTLTSPARRPLRSRRTGRLGGLDRLLEVGRLAARQTDQRVDLGAELDKLMSERLERFRDFLATPLPLFADYSTHAFGYGIDLGIETLDGPFPPRGRIFGRCRGFHRLAVGCFENQIAARHMINPSAIGFMATIKRQPLILG